MESCSLMLLDSLMLKALSTFFTIARSSSCSTFRRSTSWCAATATGEKGGHVGAAGGTVRRAHAPVHPGQVSRPRAGGGGAGGGRAGPA